MLEVLLSSLRDWTESFVRNNEYIIYTYVCLLKKDARCQSGELESAGQCTEGVIWHLLKPIQQPYYKLAAFCVHQGNKGEVIQLTMITVSLHVRASQWVCVTRKAAREDNWK